MPLTVITGDMLRRNYQVSDTQQKVCGRCEEITGVATSLFITALSAPMECKGKLTGGTSILVCAYCLARGSVETY